MATRFIHKFASTTAPGGFLNLPSAGGIGIDEADSYQLKFNKNGTVSSLIDNTPTVTISGAGSEFNLDMTTTLDAAVGSSSVTWLGGIRTVLSGAALTNTGNATNAIHGVYWITGANAGTFPKAAFLGEFHAGTTTADGAFVAMGGNGASARAMYAVATLNPDINQTSYGIDLSTNSYTGLGKAVGYTNADILMSNDVAIIVGGSSAPTDGATGANFAGPGSLYTMTGGTIKLYQNTGTKASPTWTAQT